MPARVELFGVAIDSLRMDEAVAQIQTWIADPNPRCRFVVTPNVDHIVMLQHHAGLIAAYRDAGMILADGIPVLWSSAFLGNRCPNASPDRTLCLSFFPQPMRSGLCAFTCSALGQAWQTSLRTTFAGVGQPSKYGGTYSPPLGFDRNPAECDSILARIAEAAPDVLIVGLGAPKQELWVHKYRERLAAKAVLCVGATIDFLAGERRRAPLWMQDAGLEWLYRVASEPRRLAARYARDAVIFPRLLAREWWRLRSGHAANALRGVQ